MTIYLQMLISLQKSGYVTEILLWFDRKSVDSTFLISHLTHGKFCSKIRGKFRGRFCGILCYL